MPPPSGLTPVLNFPYPIPDDAVDVPRDIQALALAIEGNLGNVVRRPVVAADIADGAITTPKIQDGAVTTPKLANGAVTIDKMGANSVAGGQIVDKSIGINEIADGHILRLFGYYLVPAWSLGPNGRADLFGTAAAPMTVNHQRNSGVWYFVQGAFATGITSAATYRMYLDGALYWTHPLSIPPGGGAAFAPVIAYNFPAPGPHNWFMEIAYGNVPGTLYNNNISSLLLLEQ